MTGADGLYNTSNLSTDDFTRECQISCYYSGVLLGNAIVKVL